MGNIGTLGRVGWHGKALHSTKAICKAGTPTLPVSENIWRAAEVKDSGRSRCQQNKADTNIYVYMHCWCCSDAKQIVHGLTDYQHTHCVNINSVIYIPLLYYFSSFLSTQHFKFIRFYPGNISTLAMQTQSMCYIPWLSCFLSK